MSMASALAVSDNANYNRVIQATFGHLAPRRRTAIPGCITFVNSPYSGFTVVDFAFEETESSPWLAQAITDYVCSLIDRYVGGDEAGMFRWEGTVTMFNNGAFRFGGETRRLNVESGARLRTRRRNQRKDMRA